MEFGTPGRVIAVPAVLALVSMGINVGEVPLGGANELVTNTVEGGLAALGTVTRNRLLYTGWLRPLLQTGGEHDAIMPAPPPDTAVKVVPETVAEAGLSLMIDTEAPLVVKPISSMLSACRVMVCPMVMVAEVVGIPAGSPEMCSRIRMGMQVL